MHPRTSELWRSSDISRRAEGQAPRPFVVIGRAGQGAFGTSRPNPTASIAFDPANNRYLIVFARFQGTEIWGQFVSSSGGLIGSNFLIQTVNSRIETPSIAHSGIDNVFFVVWRDGNDVIGQLLSEAGGVLGSPLIIANGTAGLGFVGAHPPTTIHNTTTGDFLVVWQDNRNVPQGEQDIFAQLVGIGKSTTLTYTGDTSGDFHDPAEVAAAFRGTDGVLDGEIVSLDANGFPQFQDLMFRRGELFFVAFDVLWIDGEDLRGMPLLERKRRLRRVIPSRRSRSRLRYLDHVEEDGCALYRLASERNVEGIVAKHREGLYDTRKPLWVKINPAYSQAEGREELFEELRT